MATSSRPPRRSIPLSVKLEAALYALGYTEEEIRGGQIEWDHCPALALRFVDPETGDLVPAANDPRFIRPMRKGDHGMKTHGRRLGESRNARRVDGDRHAINRAKDLEREHAAFRARLLAKVDPDAEPPPARKRKQTIPSRPFETGKRPMRTRALRERQEGR